MIHKANEGVAIARNTALSQAKGAYIGFVDGDDYCFPDMYAHLLQNALQQDVDISMSSYYESDVEVEADAVNERACDSRKTEWRKPFCHKFVLATMLLRFVEQIV